MTNEGLLAANTKRFAKVLSERMPHLVFAIWDLSEFMPAFHNVRRNMIFVECENLAREEVIRALAEDSRTMNYLVYSGERKPKAVNEAWAGARSADGVRDVIVLLARSSFSNLGSAGLGENVKTPRLEEMLASLLAYSERGWIPVPFDEVVGVLVSSLKRGARISALYRFMTRRYAGWLLAVVLYTLVERGELSPTSVDPRYLEAGKRHWLALKGLSGA